MTDKEEFVFFDSTTCEALARGTFAECREAYRLSSRRLNGVIRVMSVYLREVEARRERTLRSTIAHHAIQIVGTLELAEKALVACYGEPAKGKRGSLENATGRAAILAVRELLAQLG